MNSSPISKEKLVEMFQKGAARKLEEHEIFVMRSEFNPDRAEIYSELQAFVSVEHRYYDLAAHYYAEDFSYFEDGQNEDLLIMTKESELSPKLYAEYLREIDPSQRLNEKITHKYLLTLKDNINKIRRKMS